MNSRQSDTLFMAAKLAECFDGADESQAVLRCLEQVQGPWAFVFWHKQRRSLWFGRDFFGRQSLLLHQNDYAASFVMLASCAPIHSDFKMNEVPAHGIFRLKMDAEEKRLELFPWDVTCLDTVETKQNIFISDKRIRCPVSIEALASVSSNPIVFERNLHADEVFQRLLSNQRIREVVTQLIDRLTEAVHLRVANQPGRCKNCLMEEEVVECEHPCVGVLFSGGLDSSLLALLAGQLLSPRPVDLLNVAFQIQAGRCRFVGAT